MSVKHKKGLVLLTYLASKIVYIVGNQNVDKILLWNKVALKYVVLITLAFLSHGLALHAFLQFQPSQDVLRSGQLGQA